MARLLMTICFVGMRYHGWQVQNNAITVQQTVQDALESVIGYRPDVTGCSRTDSGVHANEYCFHFDYSGAIKCDKLVSAMNARLPKDISALSCVKVADDFHARYSVKSKQYIYKIYNEKIRNPFYEGLALHISTPLNVDLMNKAAQDFLGKHDFAGFCSSGSSVTDTVRTIYEISVEKDNPFVVVTIGADGFLYNMVRIIVGTLLYVSYGKIDSSSISDIINSKERKLAGITAPALGLYLNKVNF